MKIFGGRIRKIINEFRAKSEYYNRDLQKDISDSLEDLQSDYNESTNTMPEFLALVSEIKPKLDRNDAVRLEAFADKFQKINRTARKGVDALWDLSRSQKQMSTENLREFDEFE